MINDQWFTATIRTSCGSSRCTNNNTIGAGERYARLRNSQLIRCADCMARDFPDRPDPDKDDMAKRAKKPSEPRQTITPAPMEAGPFAPGVDFSGLPVDTSPVPTAKDVRIKKQKIEAPTWTPPAESSDSSLASGSTPDTSGDLPKPSTPEAATAPSGAVSDAPLDAASKLLDELF